MLLREWLSAQKLERRAEPAAEMDEQSSVEAFHMQGGGSGPLQPLYHFNALAVSRLVGRGGTVIDLGSGSGQYLAHLARCRPDINIVGIELAESMVTRGKRSLEKLGLSERVKLEVGDMTNVADMLVMKQIGRVDAVSCIFSLHHLPAIENVRECLQQIRYLRQRYGSAIWMFDHVRPRHPRTPEVFPEIFTPDAPPQFRQDSRNSLIAAFSFAELSRYLDEAGIGAFKHRCSRWMRLYQVHWLPAGEQLSKGEKGSAELSDDAALTEKQSLRDFRRLRQLFPDVLK